MILRFLGVLSLLVLSWATPSLGQQTVEDHLPHLQREVERRGESWLEHDQDSTLRQRDRHWLTQTYDTLGYDIEIASGEYDVYFMGLMFATAPDSEFVQISKMQGVGSRDALLKQWISEHDLSTLRFDKEAWQSESAVRDRRRFRMYKDLRSRVSFEGMAVDELTHLLGEPDRREKNALMYSLGPGLSISIGQLWFKIEGGRVDSCEVRWVD